MTELEALKILKDKQQAVREAGKGGRIKYAMRKLPIIFFME